MKLSTSARLGRLEDSRKASTPTIRVFYHDERRACLEHEKCDVEPATGEHHGGVVHLTFGDGRSVL